MKTLENRVALITGCRTRHRKGHCPWPMQRRGARLSLAARTEHELEQTAEAVRALGTATTIQTTDVTNPAQVESLVQHTLEQFGTIDILVNNAGIAGPIGPLHQNEVSAWMQTIQVNVIGTYLCCRSVPTRDAGTQSGQDH